MPTPSAEYSNSVCVQYLGATTTDYKTGYFYICKYITEDAEYKWVKIDVSDNAELANRISTVETNIGDMSDLQITGVSDIVGALNKLAIRGIKSITYTEPNLIITLQDDTTFTFDITVILQQTEIGELGNVLDSTIQNGNLLQYDSGISKYRPYDVVGALTDTYNSSKDYTDQQIAQFSKPSAYFCDAKPTCSYDSGSDQYIVVYYQNSQVHTTADISSRFYYYDANNDAYCTSWFLTEDSGVTTAVEMTYAVADVDFSDYVSKTNDVISTYTTSIVDKDKIPDIAALDALYALVVAALTLKTNNADIVDNLLSDDGTVPLSAKQGKVLKGLVDKKAQIFQYDIMPVVTSELVNANTIVEYIGATGVAYQNGQFYRANYDALSDVYSWELVKFVPDMTEITAAQVDNLWA